VTTKKSFCPYHFAGIFKLTCIVFAKLLCCIDHSCNAELHLPLVTSPKKG
jgi:hypothetical protein